MKKIIGQMVKESDMDINDVLDMPFSFFMEVIEENNKPKQQKSLISAFGG